ncbi:hypothetical protein CRP01_20050 [Flavilitoribacter nigricans DSM 23189 = NBRC 102662]|uniref:HYR domain-containing protein n=2 Tax=Flavilitoribacter TaxID=2762562 RepID=A0A2D0N8K1_FLAN2|nr:hypothetical protein CRP01_20050 [Flavilitoribacter nigricans DSM 23189 = NBRC 102662]
MKHLKRSMKQIFTKPTSTGKVSGRTRTGWRHLALCLFLLGGLSFQSNAQDNCTLVCNGTLEAPNEASLGTGCMLRIDPDHILEAPQTCPGDKLITIRDLENNLLAQATNMIEFQADEYVNQIVSVTITDQATQDFCVGYLRLSDTRPPFFTNCSPVTATCVNETDPEIIGSPLVADNCIGEIDLTFNDVVQEGNCLENNLLIIERTWTATDASGNSTECVQQITVERPSLDDVIFPAEINFSCTTPDSIRALSGRPQYEGVDLENNGPCQFEISMEEDTVFLCGLIEYQILRTWTVSDPCTGFSREDTQAINVLDSDAPVVTCPDPITVRTDPNKCSATINLPTATATDNCSSEINIEINTSYGAVGAGPHPAVPAGLHVIKYIATDACGNVGQCTTQLTVEDSDEPTAVCNDFLIISAASGGIASVKAISFDEGSSDNCADVLYYKARRMTIGGCDGLNGDDDAELTGVQEWFDDDVLFCCDEMGNGTIRILLRVYEVDPGSGPVDPAREEKGGDLYGHYSECMVQATVQDKLKPVFDFCPPAMTIDCRDDYSDLSIFGSPKVRDNCSFTLDSTQMVDVNDCGVGKIIRSFSAIDDAGNASTCLQMITIENQNPLTEEHITWPENYSTDVCGGATDPDDLPEGFARPSVPDTLCGTISVNYVDELFSLAPPACYKILRKWTVLDWCSFDPDYPDRGGKYSRIQIIKVQDTEKPILTCPDPMTISVDNDCVSGNLSLQPIVADDCSPNVLITNNSPYAANGGANISGAYPLGTTVVTISASDKCGNVATCEVSITVLDDKEPSPICIVGISAPLFDISGEPTAIVPAMTFDGGSSDNCTPDEALIKTVRLGDGDGLVAPTESELVLNCEHIGTQLVEFWVTDDAGNSNYCLTYVNVQDNSNLCDGFASGMIAGGIQNEMGDMVEDVHVQINGPEPHKIMTDAKGHFEFPDLAFGQDYTVVPYKDDNALNGVSTLDLILISKHILGIQKLNTPYKIIAADVDRSGHISTFDLIRLRRLILHIENELPSQSGSWRFVDASFQFPMPENPFATYFPEVYNINDFADAEMKADFIAIKIGDVNASAKANSLPDVERRDGVGKMTFLTANQEWKAGEELKVTFRAKDMDRYEAYQFTLAYETNALELVSTEAGSSLSNMGEENFGRTYDSDGFLTVSWNETTAIRLNEESELFTLTFNTLQPGKLSDLIAINSRLTEAEGYPREGNPQDLKLEFEEDLNPGYELLQNKPNPFQDQTTIGFHLPKTAETNLTIYDLAGKVVWQQSNVYEEGYNAITIIRSDLPTAGIFYYTLESGNFKETKKMLLVE